MKISSKLKRPRAYSVANRGIALLNERFRTLRDELIKKGNTSSLNAFAQLVQQGGIAINTSVPRCADFLESGKYLNVYEYYSQTTGRKGPALLKLVKKSQAKWYMQRREVERLLHFRLDTHYASLNLGGVGPVRYGECCILLDPKVCVPFRTCFAGDTIRAVFDRNAKRVLTDIQVRERYAPHDLIQQLAAVFWPNVIVANAPVFSARKASAALEASDSLMEIHLHGAVLIGHVKQIVMSSSCSTQLWDLTCRFENLGSPASAPMEYDVVPHFKRLVAKAEVLGIPVVAR